MRILLVALLALTATACFARPRNPLIDVKAKIKIGLVPGGVDTALRSVTHAAAVAHDVATVANDLNAVQGSAQADVHVATTSREQIAPAPAPARYILHVQTNGGAPSCATYPSMPACSAACNDLLVAAVEQGGSVKQSCSCDLSNAGC